MQIRNDQRTTSQSDYAFILRLGELPVATLNYAQSIWTFTYCQSFKDRSDEFHSIVGFRDLDKVYRSRKLWPFFLIRIPGIGQPVVQETIQRESLDATNEAQLLWRFGERSLANPFVLVRR